MKDVILLDYQPSASIFCNPSFVQDIRETNEELVLLTNGGEIRTKFEATIPDFGDVWYNPKAITIISLVLQIWKIYIILHTIHPPKRHLSYTSQLKRFGL
jgi:hypothetical protein